jgi:hypothetical protein
MRDVRCSPTQRGVTTTGSGGGASFVGASCMLPSRMRRAARATFCSLVTVIALGVTSEAAADPRTAYLAEQLKTSDDYRVRTQAALALGVSDDDGAVAPLCEALSDANVSVRVAVAAALGKLARPAGATCLEASAKTETAPGVKSQIQKSIAAVQAGASAGALQKPPPPAKDSKYYVALQVTNKSARSVDETDSLVRGAAQSRLLASKGFAVAPRDESVAQGGQLVTSKRLRGFFLVATVEAPIYEGGSLTQVVRVSVFSYPGKALKGEFSQKFSQSGTPKVDPKSEAALVKMCVDKGIETFVKLVDTL